MGNLAIIARSAQKTLTKNLSSSLRNANTKSFFGSCSKASISNSQGALASTATAASSGRKIGRIALTPRSTTRVVGAVPMFNGVDDGDDDENEDEDEDAEVEESTFALIAWAHLSHRHFPASASAGNQAPDNR